MERDRSPLTLFSSSRWKWSARSRARHPQVCSAEPRPTQAAAGPKPLAARCSTRRPALGLDEAARGPVRPPRRPWGGAVLETAVLVGQAQEATFGSADSRWICLTGL